MLPILVPLNLPPGASPPCPLKLFLSPKLGGPLLLLGGLVGLLPPQGLFIPGGSVLPVVGLEAMEFRDWRFRSVRFVTDSLFTSPSSLPISVNRDEMTDGEFECLLSGGKLPSAGELRGEVGVGDLRCAIVAVFSLALAS